MSNKPFFFVLATLLLIIAACSSAQPLGTDDNELAVGLLPIPESLPMWLADRDGYFAAEGVGVALVNFASAVERDAALQAGKLDGELNDLVAVGILNKDQSIAKVVRTAFRGLPGKPMISLVVGPASKVRSAADLRGGSIALSQNTVIEYVVDTLMGAQGVNPDDFTKTEVSKIPLRLEMLAQGQITAAGLPEPFATLAQKQGGRTVLDDGSSNVGISTLVFRTEVLAKKADAVRRFLRAYERAVGVINREPQRYRELLVDKAKVPDAVKDVFDAPPVPAASVPGEGEVKRVFDWMAAKRLLNRQLAYAEVVDGSLLPK